MKIKFIILILSIIYCGYLLILLVASHYKSSVLNPQNSEYYYQNGLLTQAIEAEPSMGEYHMYYGLELLKTFPGDKFLAQNQLHLAKKEFFRSIKLKPYSESHKRTCDIYVKWINGQF